MVQELNLCAKERQPTLNHHGRGTQLCILYTPWSHENVYGLEREILVAWNEKEHCRVRRQVRRMQENQGGTPKACRTLIAPAYPRVEI